jgi:YD repeat-containing protein
MRVMSYDGLGRLVQVTESGIVPPNGTDAVTTYAYDGLDNLVGVNQSGQTRSFTFDSLSRLTKAVNGESGTTCYTYDNDGNLQTRIQAAASNCSPGTGILTSYNYDYLNRLTSKVMPEGTAIYTYDLGTYGLGRLYSVNLTSAQRHILKDVSARQDSILGGGQSGPLSFQHAMRGPGQSVADAQSEYQDFVSMNEDQAMKTQISFWAAGNPGLSSDALAQFAAALHAVLDSTSPVHAGFQVWEWWNPSLVWKHHWAENTISPQQLNTVVSAAKNAFNTTFTPPRFNEFDLLHLMLQPQQTEVKSKICYTLDDGKKVCQ